MTDLEMTKLCAEAMEPPPDLPGSSAIWGVTKQYAPVERTMVWVRSTYNPLHDDAQAMALVKRFALQIVPHIDYENGSIEWTAEVEGRRFCTYSDGGANLNRAIVECVAKMQSKTPSR
jgi:seryl-tRNA synthetase